MPIEGCAFVCWILAACSAVLYWAAWGLGYMEATVIATIYALVEVVLCIYVLAMKYCA